MEIISAIFFIAIFIFSAVLHEIAHGWAANALGDPTAKNEGRLSLNPLRHLDPIGSVLLPATLILLGGGFIFGWAKPVPYNPYNLRDQKRDPALVALAGPAVNLLIALVFGFLLRGLLVWPGLAVNAYGQSFSIILAGIVWVNILLGVFNLVPIPPLDGSKILFSFLPAQADKFRFVFERYGFIILIIFIFFGFSLLVPVMNLLFNLIVGQPFA